METYTHKVAGIYITPTTAKNAYDCLTKAGFDPEQITFISPHDPYVSSKIEPEGDGIKEHILLDIAAGAGIGALLGVASTIVMKFMALGLFASQPYAGPLLVLMYSTMLGAVMGAVFSLRPGEYKLAARIRDLIRGQHYAIVVHTRSRDEKERAKRMIGDTTPESTFAY